MPKSMEFAIGRTVVYERHTPGSESAPKMIAWKVQRVWDQRGDASEFSGELFEALKISSVTKETFAFQEVEIKVPAAPQGSGEWLGRRIMGEPTEAYSYTDYYVTINLPGGFAYRIEEKKQHIQPLKDLLASDALLTVVSNENGGYISIGPVEERGWSFSIIYAEILRSPLHQKFKRRKAYK
jgi:hypothetical protein